MLIRRPRVFLPLLLRYPLVRLLHQKPPATCSAPASTLVEYARQPPSHLLKRALLLPPVRLCSSNSQAAELRLAACTVLCTDARAIQTLWRAVVLLVSRLGAMLPHLTTPTVILQHVWLVLLACSVMMGPAPSAFRRSGLKQNPASLLARTLFRLLSAHR